MLAILVMTASVPLLATQLTSNTATTATFLPVGGAVAVALGADPLIFCLAVTLAANSAFCLPVGTPPNAMVYGTGRMTQQDMLRSGLLLVAVAVAVITLVTLVLAPLVFAG